MANAKYYKLINAVGSAIAIAFMHGDDDYDLFTPSGAVSHHLTLDEVKETVGGDLAEIGDLEYSNLGDEWGHFQESAGTPEPPTDEGEKEDGNKQIEDPKPDPDAGSAEGNPTSAGDNAPSEQAGVTEPANLAGSVAGDNGSAMSLPQTEEEKDRDQADHIADQDGPPADPESEASAA